MKVAVNSEYITLTTERRDIEGNVIFTVFVRLTQNKWDYRDQDRITEPDYLEVIYKRDP